MAMLYLLFRRPGSALWLFLLAGAAAADAVPPVRSNLLLLTADDLAHESVGGIYDRQTDPGALDELGRLKDLLRSEMRRSHDPLLERFEREATSSTQTANSYN